MTVPIAPGGIDYTQSGAAKWIPYVFSKKTITKFYDASVIPAIANSDYAGEIKNMGDKVVIRTVPDVTVNDYTKDMVITYQNLNSAAVELNINKAKYFAFKLDKIDIKQIDIDMLDKSAQDASEQMKVKIDDGFLADIYTGASSLNKGATAGRKSADINLGATGTPITISKTNVLDYIVDCGVVLDEQNLPESDRWIVIPAWMSGMIKKSDLKDASLSGDGTSILRNGRLGLIDRFTLFNTNLYTKVTDGANSCYNIIFGHKSAICFAAQLTETEYFDKFETTFGSGMKGLNLYDYKAIKPESFGVLYVTK